MNSSRQSLLKTLIKNRFNGNQAAFGRAIDKSPGQVNQWLTGYRSIGDWIARHIEIALNLGNGWMDSKSSQPAPITEQPETLEDQVIRMLAGMPDYYAEAWLDKVKGHAAMQRAEQRATKEAHQQQEDRINAEQARDPPPIGRRRTTCS